MDIELATLEDIVNELRRRRIRFVLVGIEPSNERGQTAQIGASGHNLSEILRLLRLGRSVLEEDRYEERRKRNDLDDV